MLNLTKYGQDLTESELDLAGVGRISYIASIELGGSSFGEETPPTSVLWWKKPAVNQWERWFGKCWSGLDTPTQNLVACSNKKTQIIYLVPIFHQTYSKILAHFP